MKTVFQSKRLQSLIVEANEVRFAIHFVVGQLAIVTLRGGLVGVETGGSYHQFEGELATRVAESFHFNTRLFKNLGNV